VHVAKKPGRPKLQVDPLRKLQSQKPMKKQGGGRDGGGKQGGGSRQGPGGSKQGGSG
jgi:hypothetical protein